MYVYALLRYLAQDDAEDNEESRLEFSNTQGAARQKVASAAAKPSKEVQSEVRSLNRSHSTEETRFCD